MRGFGFRLFLSRHLRRRTGRGFRLSLGLHVGGLLFRRTLRFGAFHFLLLPGRGFAFGHSFFLRLRIFGVRGFGFRFFLGRHLRRRSGRGFRLGLGLGFSRNFFRRPLHLADTLQFFLPLGSGFAVGHRFFPGLGVFGVRGFSFGFLRGSHPRRFAYSSGRVGLRLHVGSALFCRALLVGTF